MVGEPNYWREKGVTWVVGSGWWYFTVYEQSRCMEQWWVKWLLGKESDAICGWWLWIFSCSVNIRQDNCTVQQSFFFKFFLNGEAIVVAAVFSPIDTERLKQKQPTCTNKRGRVMILQTKPQASMGLISASIMQYTQWFFKNGAT